MTEKSVPLYPLTSSQREIWFEQMLYADIPLYNIGGYVNILGPLDPVLFEQAVNLLVGKHDALRTILQEKQDKDGVPLQAFPEELRVTVPIRDFSAAGNPHEASLVWMQEHFEQTFTLVGQPLFRYDLLKLADDHWYSSQKYHHLITDGWSIAMINRLLAEIYTTLTDGKVPNIDSPSYIGFIEDDRRYIESQVFEKNRQYWLEQYRNVPEPLFAPRYRSQDSGQTAGSGCETLYLDRAFYGQLEELARKYGATLFHVLLGALYVYFTRTGQRDNLPIGLPVLNRSKASFRRTAGLFVGISSVLFDFGKKLSFGELLRRIGETLRAGYRHQRCPITEINRAVGLDKGRARLFDVSLSYEHHDYDLSFSGAAGYSTPLLHGHEQIPLVIFVREFHAEQAVKFDFVYNFSYFNSEEIQALQARFINILEAVLQQDTVPVHSLPVMPERELQLLAEWNDTAAEYPADRTIVDLFEEQVKKTPENIALVFEDQQLTYRDLNEKANQFAHALIERDVRADTLVAICVERSPEMIIGLLGILKAGGAYVPLDPDYPEERLRFMLRDCGAEILLTQTHLHERLPGFAGPRLDLDDPRLYTKRLMENPQRYCGPEDLAYVIYTSGSTGRPKGVMVEHRHILNLLYSYESMTSHPDPFNGTAVSPFSFDVAVWESFSALCFGGALHILQREQFADPDNLAGYIRTRQIHSAYIPPALLADLRERLHPDEWSLQRLLVGVESIQQSLLQDYRELAGDNIFYIINAYGPTETTICSSWYNFQRSIDRHRNTPVGGPIANTRIYILDAGLEPLPPGISGELCIAGAGLARGYLNRPELTAEKFVEVGIFEKTERIYRTGDLARWLPDGNLEYLGRIDHQVKLRGFRIELGEIEAALTKHEAISEAVVVLHEREGNKSLAAYLTVSDGPENDTASLPAELRGFLKESLPEYMVPSSFTVLEKLPLTSNGKIDRKALPDPDAVVSSANYEAPRTDTEQRLADIWADVLKRSDIGIHDNFFDLGGDSILSIRITARAKQAGLDLSTRDIFLHQSIAELAQAVQPINGVRAEANQGIILGKLPLPEDIPLSFSQEERWISSRNSDNHQFWTDVLLCKIIGNIDVPTLELSFEQLARRHDTLRTVYPVKEGKPLQKILPKLTVNIPLIRLDHKEHEIDRIIKQEKEQPLDLINGPTWRVKLIQLENNSYVISLCVHHINGDATSNEIFLREVFSLYEAISSGQPADLVPLTIQYADFAYWQRRYYTQERLEKRLEYYERLLTPEPSRIDFFSGRNETAETGPFPSAVEILRVEPELLSAVKTLSNERGATLFAIVFAAVAGLLHRHTGSEDILFGAPMSKRLHEGVEPLIGDFSGMTLLRLGVKPNMKFSELLRQAVKAVQSALTNQELSYKQVANALNRKQDIKKYSPVILNYLPAGTWKAEIDYSDFSVYPYSYTAEINKTMMNDLSLFIREINSDAGPFLNGGFRYRSDLIESATIKGMKKNLITLLESVVTDPLQPVGNIKLDLLENHNA